MICRCGKEHDGSFGSGKFCSRACANARVFSESSNKKRAESVRSTWTAERKVRTGGLVKQSWVDGLHVPTQQAAGKRVAELAKAVFEAFWKAGGVGERPLSNSVFRRLALEKLGEQCSKCGCSGTWQGEALSLHIDHIDGDSTNNKTENLRILCPNCHSQTPTFGSKNKGKSTRKWHSVAKK